MRFSRPCLWRVRLLGHDTVSKWVVLNTSKHCSAFIFEHQTVQKDCLAMYKQWPTLSIRSVTFIWNSFQDGGNLSKHTQKYILTLCKTKDFEKADFLYAVNKHKNEWSVRNGNKCSCKISVLHWTTTFSFLVGWNGHTSWLQSFLVTRSSSELVFNERIGWRNKNRMYAHRKSLFQSGCHTKWLGLNMHFARMHKSTRRRKWEWPLIYSHLQDNFHFSWTCTAQLWWLSDTWSWWL